MGCLNNLAANKDSLVRAQPQRLFSDCEVGLVSPGGQFEKIEAGQTPKILDP
jgi:hypothetical protein